MSDDASTNVDSAEKQETSSDALTSWAKEPSVLDLKNDLTAAQPSNESHKRKVERWTNLRNIEGSARPKKVKGRSRIQPKLIRRQNEWRYSALSEPFLSSSKLFDVEPVTWEDEHSARQNELVLNWQFRTKMNKVSFIDEYVRTAVDEGTVIVRVGWSRETEMETVKVPVFTYYAIETQEQKAALTDAIELKKNNPKGFTDLPEEIQEAVTMYEETGQETYAEITSYEDAEEEKVLVNEPTAEIVDPDNIFIDPSCKGDHTKAKFVIFSYETTKAELMKDDRYKNLSKVNWSGNRVLAQPDHTTQTPTDFQLNDELRSPVVVYEYWGNYDVDGDETLTPIVASWIGDTMIRMEENPFPDKKHPFVVVPYLPVKRSVMGEPDAEILEDNQATLGAFMRGIIDLMARSANSQTGTAKNFLDVTNKRRFEAGQDYEFNPGSGDPRLSVYQHSYPEIPNSALTMLNLQNNEAEALSGVKAFSGGLSGEGYGDVAAGIKGMLDASAKREMNILRRLAKGILQIGQKISSMNAIFMTEEEVVRVTNEKFVTVKREELAGNFDLKVDINTPEVDESKAQDLGFMLQTMGPNMDPMIVNMILADIAELKRMPTLAHKLKNYKPQPNPVAQKKEELEVAKLELELAEMQAEIAETQAKTAKLKSETDKNNLEFVEEETGTKHERDMQKISAQAEANQDLAVTNALIAPQKEGEKRPDVETAIGFNHLTKGNQAPLG
mgnify:CR=1 FL=1